MSLLFDRVLLPLSLLPSQNPAWPALKPTDSLLCECFEPQTHCCASGCEHIVQLREMVSTIGASTAARCAGRGRPPTASQAFMSAALFLLLGVERHSACDTISGFCWVGPTADCSVLPCKAWRAHPFHLSCISLSLACTHTHRTTSEEEEEALLEKERRLHRKEQTNNKNIHPLSLNTTAWRNQHSAPLYYSALYVFLRPR